jgi:hypothetical protein
MIQAEILYSEADAVKGLRGVHDRGLRYVWGGECSMGTRIYFVGCEVHLNI